MIAVRRGAPRFVMLTVLMAMLTGCTSPSNTPTTPPGPSTTYDFPAPSTSSFVSAQGTSFLVDGKPFRFVGANVYDAAATDRYSCDPAARMTDDELKSTFKTLHERYGATVIRFWAYQTYTKSGQDWSGMDAVIAAAKDAGMRVFPVLEDGPGYCTTSTDVQPKSDYQNDTWFVDGYRKNYGTAPRSFRDYAKIVVEHYRDEPTIFGWSLINEADTSARDSQDRSVLVDFAQDMATVIHDADKKHLITLGTQSNGARGASGPDFAAVYGVKGMDFAEVHDWGYWGSDADPMPGGSNGKPPAADSAACQATNAPIGCSFAQLKTLNKPLVVGEAGIAGGDASAQSTRADQLGAKMDAAFAAGASGYLLWRVTKQITDKYDITLDGNDPLLTRLGAAATKLG